jgi:regulator of sigma E protease
VNYAVLLNPGEVVKVRFKRGSETLEKSVQLEKDPQRSLGKMGITPSVDVLVSEVSADMPAAKAGLKKGDVIKSIDGLLIRGTEAVPMAIQRSQGKPIKIVVDRNESGSNVSKELTITPTKRENRWLIGFAPIDRTVLIKMPLSAALKESFSKCKEHVEMTGVFLSKLFTGRLSLRATSGPFEIAKLSDAARSTSLSTFLLFIGTISFDIGLINLLPIPALDGGHIFFLVLEGITRRELSIRVKERVTMVGFVFLVGVMLVVLYYDILRTGTVQHILEQFSR